MRRVAGEKYLGAVLILLLLVNTASATPLPAGADVASALALLVPVTIMLLLFGEGLIYMLATAASIPRTEAWVKTEFREILITLLIMTLVLSAIATGNIMTKTLTGEDTYIDAGAKYLDEERDDMIALHGILTHDVFVLTKITGFQYDISFGIGPISTFESKAPKAGLNALNTAVYGALDSLSQSIMIVSVEKMFLFFFDSFFRYLFPLAIVLRALPMTRKLGGAMIAIAVGTYIAFPTSVILAGDIYKEAKDTTAIVPPSETYLGDMVGIPPGMSIICNAFMPIFTDIGENGWDLIICTPICIASKAQPELIPICHICHPLVKIMYVVVHAGFSVSFAPKLKAYANKGDLNIIYPVFSDKALPAVSQRFTLTLLLMLFIVIVTIGCTKSVSEAIGGEGQLYGLSRIV